MNGAGLPILWVAAEGMLLGVEEGVDFHPIGTDRRGSMVFLENELLPSTGAFGEKAGLPSAVAERHVYAGLEKLPQAPFFSANHRLYDPEVGRFLSRDPLGREGGDHLFAYAGNDPLGFVDPEGLSVLPDEPTTTTIPGRGCFPITIIRSIGHYPKPNTSNEASSDGSDGGTSDGSEDSEGSGPISNLTSYDVDNDILKTKDGAVVGPIEHTAPFEKTTPDGTKVTCNAIVHPYDGGPTIGILMGSSGAKQAAVGTSPGDDAGTGSAASGGGPGGGTGGGGGGFGGRMDAIFSAGRNLAEDAFSTYKSGVRAIARDPSESRRNAMPFAPLRLQGQ